jgi:hypothetical protein
MSTEKVAEIEERAPSTESAPGARRGYGDFETVRQISDNGFKACLLETSSIQAGCGSHPITSDECEILGRIEGAFNLVVFLGFRRNGKFERYAIRVPAHGTVAHWTEEDEYLMKRQIQLMRQIRCNTTVPVPKVIACYPHLNNTLGAPWMLTEMLPGKNALHIWFDESYDRQNAYLNADKPSPETHRKRVVFLTSLAGFMVQLLRLEFDRIGLPEIQFEHNVQDANARQLYGATIGPSYHCTSLTDYEFAKRGPFDSTQQYLKHGLKEWNYEDLGAPHGEDDQDIDDDDYVLLGIHKVMEIVLSCAVFNPDRKTEKFVIHHNDLDL